MPNVGRMTLVELKSTIILALIFACRMLGLFMVLPVLALYTPKIAGATPFLIGIALGIYGLTQALFQFPFGLLSDYISRKRVILGGLVLFIIGSLLAAFSTSIWGLLIGRAIQGAGAIGSPVLALVADCTREEVRTRAMAVIGISIGLTFVVAILVGPLLDAAIGLTGIFFTTAALALGGIVLLGALPAPTLQLPAKRLPIQQILKEPQLWRLNLNIFLLHAMLTAVFLILPGQIQTITEYSSTTVWRFYAPVLVIALVIMAPFLRYADNLVWQKRFMQTAMIGLGISIVWLINATQFSSLVMAAILFFVTFNFLEACFPALVSRVAPKEGKGTALGIYAFCQFFGMFIGGVVGGWMQEEFGAQGIGYGCLILAILSWFILLKKVRNEKWQEA